MPLSRVAMAAVFFVVGVLIVVPMFVESSSTSSASSTPGPDHSVTSSAPSKTTRGDSATTPAAHTPASSRPSPTAKATTRPAHPAKPSAAAVPLEVTTGELHCPGRTLKITVANRGNGTEDYAITTNGSVSVTDRVGPRSTRTSSVTLPDGRTSTVTVTWHEHTVRSVKRKVDCANGGSDKKLPYTGTNRAVVFARIATGVAALLTGAIIFWYGRQWPRRKDRMFEST